MARIEHYKNIGNRSGDGEVPYFRLRGSGAYLRGTGKASPAFGQGVGRRIGAGVGDDVAYGVFDWVDLSGILLVIALIGAVGLVWLWPGSGE